MEAHIEEVPTNTKRDKGFTLVELLIVIVILGILATVTVFAVRGITDKGQDNACLADKKTLEVAAEAWFAQNSVAAIPSPAAAGTTITGEAYSASPEGQLVKDGLLRSESPTYNVDTDGKVTAVAAGPCA